MEVRVRGTWKKDLFFSVAVSILCGILWFLPTGFEERLPQDTLHARGEVLETDNSLVRQFGIINMGHQELRVRVTSEPWKGATVDVENPLIGKLEMDTFYTPRQKVLLNINEDDGKITTARAVGIYRLAIESWLFLLFAVVLIAVGGMTGFKALLSFIFTVLVLWKAMIPLFLQGYDPISVSLGLLTILSGVIIFLIGGCRKRGVVAFTGTLMGLFLTCALGLIFSQPFGLHGAVRPFSETLLYAGFGHLNLKKLFLAGIFFASSGAVMDLSMDIAAAMDEVQIHGNRISRWKLFLSGLSVGRAVIGTMTTTLVLAYSGSYLVMLMYFMGQGIPLNNMLNLNYVSAEILHTLAGSFGLVMVAPFTALVGAFIFVRNPDTERTKASQKALSGKKWGISSPN